MSEQDTESQKPARKRPHRSTSQGFRDKRAEALQAALRANLKRRKVATRPESAPEAADHEKAQQKDTDEA